MPRVQAAGADAARTPSLAVLDWSKPSDRAEVQRLRAKHPTPPVSQKRINLPMLLACSPNGACKEWVGASRIRGALAALGFWREDVFPSAQLAVAAFGFAIGLVLGRLLRPAAPLLLLAAALGAVARLGEQCSTCGSEQSWTTFFTVGAGLGACLLGWMLMPRAFAGSWASLAVPLLLGAMLAGQLALVIAEPAFCLGCVVFLAGVALAAGCCARFPFAHPGEHGVPLMRGALRAGFGAATAAFGLLAVAAMTSPALLSESGGRCASGVSRSNEEELARFVGKASTDFLRREGRPVVARSSVLVIGVPACPACENAFRVLQARLAEPVLFVRPMDDTRDVSGWFPYPRDTLASRYRSTAQIGTAPIIVITDAAGKVIWGQTFWRSHPDDQAAFVAEISRRLSKEGVEK